MEVFFMDSYLADSFIFLTGYVLPFLFVLTVIVFFHELGHFLVARWFGVKVLKFSIGFGPEIFGWDDKHNTRWRISLIPLGGYVSFAGENNASDFTGKDVSNQGEVLDNHGFFYLKPLYARICIVLAGPLSNFIFSLFIFTFIFLFVGERVSIPRVDVVFENSPAAEAGFLKDDILLSVDGKDLTGFHQFQKLVELGAGNRMEIKVERQDKIVTLFVTPQWKKMQNVLGDKGFAFMIGIQSNIKKGEFRFISYQPHSAFFRSVEEFWFITRNFIATLGSIGGGAHSLNQLGGPLKIAQISGQVAEFGFLPLINFVALLSISIGLFNLLPIPPLDGGHLLFYGFEGLFGRSISNVFQSFAIGFALILLSCFMIVITWNDFQNIFSPLL
ncbi:MAG: RIP metalloprotease RseP [Alphaproteobacteria bacterium]|nr:RIP metalloprotease RseP [Alphaproteobacteria bacterium]